MSIKAGLASTLDRTTLPRWWVIAIAVYLFLSFLAGPFISHLHKSLGKEHGDWLSIYNIAHYSVTTGELKAPPEEDVVITERYPPIARPMLMLFAVPPKPVSAVLSFLLFAALYGWCAVRLAEIFLRPTGRGMWAGAILMALPVAPYVWADLTACNLTSVLLWSVTAAFVYSHRGQWLRAGLAISVGITLKMIPGICLVYFVLRREWRVAWGALVGVIALGLLPSLAIFGPQKLWDYHGQWYREEFTKFTPMATIDRPVECLYQNQAVVRTMVRMFTHTNAGHSDQPFYVQIAEPPRWVLKAAYAAIMGASVAGLLWVLWRARRAQSIVGTAGAYALCVGAMLWLSPWVASYYFSLAMWPAGLLLGQYLSRGEAGPGDDRAATALAVWIVVFAGVSSQVLRALGVTMWGAMVLLLANARLVVRSAAR